MRPNTNRGFLLTFLARAKLCTLFFSCFSFQALLSLPVEEPLNEKLLSQFLELEKNYLHQKALVEALEKERAVLPSICQGRLTGQSATPIPITVAAAGTIYFTPYRGNKISLYDGTNWKMHTFSELSLALSGVPTASKPYDIFIYDNAGTPTLEFSSAWAAPGIRTDALTTVNGIYVKSGATTRRYLGTIYVNVAKQVYDRMSNRNIWNNCNRVMRTFGNVETVDSATTTTTSWALMYSGSGISPQVTLGLSDVLVSFRPAYLVGKATSAAGVSVGVAWTPTTNLAQLMGGQANTIHATQIRGEYIGYPGLGFSGLFALWNTDGSATITYYGDNGGTTMLSGGSGIIYGG